MTFESFSVILPVLIPLFGGAILLLLPNATARRIVSTLTALATLAASIFIAVGAFSGEILIMQGGSWPAPYGITLVVDKLTALMLLLSSSTGLLTVLHSGSSLNHAPTRGRSNDLNIGRERFSSQALYQFLFMGVNMSFITGDLFNLFVAFEVMLIASYGLLLIGGELRQLREGFKYVVMNLIIGALFVVTAGAIYALTGTLNMADIALKVAAYSEGVPNDLRLSLLVGLLALVFAAKAAVFPLGFWLPYSYPAPTASTSAFFGAVLTKVGVYALLRTFTLLFPQQETIGQVILGLAGLTMIIGALGALSQDRWRHMLAFANIASVGYLVMGIFIGTEAGTSAAVYYMINSVLVIFTLFLIASLAEKIAGRSYDSEGHMHSYPVLAVMYFIAMLALAGLPPTSGFIGKYGLIQALAESPSTLNITVLVLAIVTSLVLLYAGVLVWRRFFWGERDAVHTVQLPLMMRATTLIALALVIGLTVFSGPIYSLAQGIAQQVSYNDDYIELVLHGPHVDSLRSPDDAHGHSGSDHDDSETSAHDDVSHTDTSHTDTSHTESSHTDTSHADTPAEHTDEASPPEDAAHTSHDTEESPASTQDTGHTP